ncbi:hypothetical protein ACL02U_30370 [Streptomyces sp. MS06]|uniref:LppU/SCO3897 family protein n=1 Tax=Streptomyces sp. MS06 TaxID=3385974 RepID=UPI00399F587D
MSADRPAPVDVTTLVLGDRLGQGGQGTVHQVRNKRVNRGAADGDWEVVYKEYGAAVLPGLDTAALDSAVALLGRLSGEDGRWLCEKTAWPAVVVQRGGGPCGFLMRAVPDRFRFTLRSMAGAGAGPRRLATMEYLLNDDAYVAGIGLTVGDRDRLLLLADLAATLNRLHGFGIAVGDVSPKNLLFSLSPRPECFLIDSDAMRLRGASVLPQAETPDWQVPAGEELATPASDVHKLGLLAIRLFARDQTTRDPADLSRAGSRLGDLARASLRTAPERRPTAAAWAEQLASAATTATNHPKKKKNRPRPARKPTGQPAGPGAGSPGPGGRPGSAGPGQAVRPRRPNGAAAANALGVLKGVAGILAAVLLIVGSRYLHSQADDVATTNGVGWSSSPFPLPSLTWGRTGGPAADPGDTYDDSDDDSGDDSTDDSDDSAYDGSDGSDDSAADAPDTESAAPADPGATAEVGDCFHDDGGSKQADLSSADCGVGTFKVVRVNTGTTDLDSCDDVTDSDESVSFTAYDRVLCLSYQSSGGSAFHARQGECVFGAPDDDAWSKLSCRAGAFKVLAVYRGTTAHSKCDNWPHYNRWRTMTVPGNSSLDVLLCMSMQYPDDAGYATRNECLVKSGNTFTNAGSCAKSNVYVTGRTSRYADRSFCGRDGATWWHSTYYPAFSYTVCWRWR